MKRSFTITDKEYETDSSGRHVVIDGTYQARVTPQNGRKYQIKINGTSKDVWILEKEGGTYVLGVDGKEVRISATDPFGELRTKMGFQAVEESHENEVKAPMPGKLIEVLVAEGDEVAEGSSLFILEAMKMENIVKSPSDGIVSAILSEAGETVQKNDVIIKF